MLLLVLLLVELATLVLIDVVLLLPTRRQHARWSGRRHRLGRLHVRPQTSRADRIKGAVDTTLGAVAVDRVLCHQVLHQRLCLLFPLLLLLLLVLLVLPT